jgi:hypothetical protein
MGTATTVAWRKKQVRRQRTGYGVSRNLLVSRQDVGATGWPHSTAVTHDRFSRTRVTGMRNNTLSGSLSTVIQLTRVLSMKRVIPATLPPMVNACKQLSISAIMLQAVVRNSAPVMKYRWHVTEDEILANSVSVMTDNSLIIPASYLGKGGQGFKSPPKDRQSVQKILVFFFPQLL